MLRILLDPARPNVGEYDHPMVLATIIEREVFNQLGHYGATINAFRRGQVFPTEREKEHIVKTWMPDVIISVSEATDSAGVRVTKTAGASVEYLPADIPENRFDRQAMETALAPYYALADKVITGLRKSFSDKLPQPEAAAEAPPVEEPAPEPAPVEEEPTADATEEVTESAG